MSLEHRLTRLEKQSDTERACSLCASSAAKDAAQQQASEDSSHLRVVKEKTITFGCPKCGSPRQVILQSVERAAA